MGGIPVILAATAEEEPVHIIMENEERALAVEGAVCIADDAKRRSEEELHEKKKERADGAVEAMRIEKDAMRRAVEETQRKKEKQEQATATAEAIRLAEHAEVRAEETSPQKGENEDDRILREHEDRKRTLEEDERKRRNEDDAQKQKECLCASKRLRRSIAVCALTEQELHHFHFRRDAKICPDGWPRD